MDLSSDRIIDADFAAKAWLVSTDIATSAKSAWSAGWKDRKPKMLRRDDEVYQLAVLAVSEELWA